MLKPIRKQRIEEVFFQFEKNPSLISFPIKKLEEFKSTKYLHPSYISKWEEMLKLPLSEIKEKMLKENENGEILRSTSIFMKNIK